MWLLDIKKLSPDTVAVQETKKLFLEFMEDYNTATLPHRKYVTIRSW